MKVFTITMPDDTGPTDPWEVLVAVFPELRNDAVTTSRANGRFGVCHHRLNLAVNLEFKP